MRQYAAQKYHVLCELVSSHALTHTVSGIKANPEGIWTRGVAEGQSGLPGRPARPDI